jgi:hypothetical protein
MMIQHPVTHLGDPKEVRCMARQQHGSMIFEIVVKDWNQGLMDFELDKLAVLNLFGGKRHNVAILAFDQMAPDLDIGEVLDPHESRGQESE